MVLQLPFTAQRHTLDPGHVHTKTIYIFLIPDLKKKKLGTEEATIKNVSIY